MSRIADAVARSAGPDDAPPRLSIVAEGASPFGVTPPQAWSFDSDVVDPPAVPAARLVDARDGDSPAETSDEAPQPNLIELVQHVFRPGGEALARTVAIAGIGHSAPPRTLIFALARTLASYDAGTVCIVDASGGEARLDRVGWTPTSAGLSDLLASTRPAASVAVPVGPRVWLVPAGTGTVTPASRPDALARAFDALAAAFDFVIVAAPAGADGGDLGPLLTLAAATDGLVVTLRMDATRRDVAANLVSRIRAAGVALLGAVVVDVDRGAPASSREVTG